MASNLKARLPLEGKTAVVTGGTRGIGLELARKLVASGCQVAITGRTASSLKKASQELGAAAIAVRCDVGQQQDVQRFAREVQKRFGKLDFLVNNAGTAHALKNADELSPTEWKDVLDTNLTGQFLVTHLMLRFMSAGSVIVNNLSVAAEQVFPGMSAYNASKFGALGFTSCLREELRPRGIRVMALIPGATDTDIWNQFWPEAPRKKMVSPAIIAQAVVQALLTPAEASVDVLRITPASGTL